MYKDYYDTITRLADEYGTRPTPWEAADAIANAGAKVFFKIGFDGEEVSFGDSIARNDLDGKSWHERLAHDFMLHEKYAGYDDAHPAPVPKTLKVMVSKF